MRVSAGNRQVFIDDVSQADVPPVVLFADESATAFVIQQVRFLPVFACKHQSVRKKHNRAAFESGRAFTGEPEQARVNRVAVPQACRQNDRPRSSSVKVLLAVTVNSVPHARSAPRASQVPFNWRSMSVTPSFHLKCAPTVTAGSQPESNAPSSAASARVEVMQIHSLSILLPYAHVAGPVVEARLHRVS